jgi:TonB family protein
MSFVMKATVVFLLAWGLAILLRRSSASIRHSIWAASLLVVSGVPALERMLPQASVDPTGGFLLKADAVASKAAPGSWDWVAPLWLAGILLQVLRAVVAQVRLERMRRASTSAGKFGGINLLHSPEEMSPMAAGLLRPVIILPASSDSWSASLRESVLRHEQAHILRRDLWWSRLADACCAALWFHPLAWLAAREMRREAEKACDDMVLNSGAAPADYAEGLIRVARSTSAAPEAAVAMTGRSPLESRVRAILNSRASRRPANALAVALAGVVLFTPLAAYQEPYKAGEHKDITLPKRTLKVNPKYTQSAKDAGVEGVVKLSAVITREGVPDQVKVVESLEPSLDEEAVKAVKQWKFEPATRQGKPVAVLTTIEIKFTLLP